MIDTLNTASEFWWPYVLHATWQATLVAAIAIAFVFAFRRLPAPWRYALLLVALVKFAFPPIVSWKYSLFTATGPTIVLPVAQRPAHYLPRTPPNMGAAMQIDDAGPATAVTSTSAPRAEIASTSLAQADASTPPATAPQTTAAQSAAPAQPFRSMLAAISRVTWKSWLMILHACGALAVLVYIAVGLRQLIRLNRRAARVTEGPLKEAVDRQRKRLELADDVDLLISEEEIPPFAYWLLRPKVLLPRTLVDSLDSAGLETVLAHEIIHHRRNDWAANFLQLLMAAAWWFNPVIYLLNRMLTNTREECCDDALLGLKLTDSKSYCNTLITTAERITQRQPIGTTLGFAERLHPMAGRIKRISDKGLKRVPKLSSGAMVVTALICIAVLPGGKSEAERPKPAPVNWADMLTLKIVDEETGEPVPNVSLQVSRAGASEPLTTDEDGTAEVGYDAANHKSLYLYVNAPNYVPMRMGWQSDAPPLEVPQAFKLKLPKGITVGGTVRNEDNHPIENASVFLHNAQKRDDGSEYWLIDHKMQSDADGRWSTDAFPADLTQVSLRTFHPDFVSDTHYRQVPPSDLARMRDRSLELLMRSGVSFTGRVVDADGQPITGVSVTQADAFSGVHSLSSRTDEDGVFSFRSVKPGGLLLLYDHPQFAPQQTLLDISPGGELSLVSMDESRTVRSEEIAELQVILTKGGVLRGRVEDEEGRPLNDAEVRLQKWRDRKVYKRMVRTDTEGRFQIDRLPEETILWSVHRKGYSGVEDLQMRPGAEDYTVTLPRRLRITGRVIDADTGQALKEFTVRTGKPYSDSIIAPLWSSDATQSFSDGQFEVNLNGTAPGYFLLIDSEGYASRTSHFISYDEGDVTYDAVLRRREGPRGVVLTPDGAPAAGARVALAIPGDGVRAYNGRIGRNDGHAMVETSIDGKYALPAHDGLWMIGVTHDDGYAMVSKDAYPGDGAIRLTPWGRVEGYVRKGGKPAEGEIMMVDEDTTHQATNHYELPHVDFDQFSRTDSHGRYFIQHAVTGDVIVRRTLSMGAAFGGGQSTSVGSPGVSKHLAPGETLVVNFDDEVRQTITGRFVLPKEHATGVNWSEVKIQAAPPVLYAKEHFPPILPRADDIAIQDDGTFTVANVAGGLYALSVKLPMEPMEINGDSRPRSASAWWPMFEVPGMEGAELLDIGEVRIEVTVELNAGHRTPDFAVEGLDGRMLRLADYRGRYVLLHFWASNVDQRHQQTQHLREVYEAFGGDNRLAVIGLAIDASREASENYIKEHDIRWPQAYLGNHADTDLPEKYGNAGMSSVWLIGPDGRVVAKDLRGEAIIQAVREALGR